MKCKKCGQLLIIKISYIGAPVNREREYVCNACGIEYKGIPEKGYLEEIVPFVKKEL